MSESEEKTAAHGKLQTETDTLIKQIQSLQKAVKDANATRENEHATNEATIKEAKVAQDATEKAIGILEEFYGKASFTQLAVTKAYTGMGGAKKGVVGLLQTIASDFARLMTETQTAEDQNSEAHQQFLDESSEDLAVKDAELT